MWEPPAFFEDLGVRYNGPFDGHDIDELERALRNAAQFDGPTVIHVLTQKGRGYAPAENDPIKRLHDMGGCPQAQQLHRGVHRGPHQGGRGPPRARGHHRRHARQHRPAARSRSASPTACIDVGIAEQHAVTAAAGMAMGGLRPVVAVYSTFLTRAFDQVNLDVGLHGQPVVFCLDRAGITGDDGPPTTACSTWCCCRRSRT
jgi:1-deoxy-D-xylulose-5-phosphate synthase